MKNILSRRFAALGLLIAITMLVASPLASAEFGVTVSNPAGGMTTGAPPTPTPVTEPETQAPVEIPMLGVFLEALRFAYLP